jgi:hypothetical protein
MQNRYLSDPEPAAQVAAALDTTRPAAPEAAEPRWRNESLVAESQRVFVDWDVIQQPAASAHRERELIFADVGADEPPADWLEPLGGAL